MPVKTVNCRKKNALDYFSFGMPMPGRNIVGDYRYAFQGQEKDPETGMEAFELRLWDSRIGRWLTTDPKNIHSSPYLGMGNDPINLYDPDGGSPLDIIFRTYNATTGAYDTALIIKSELIKQTFDIHLPVGINNPITGSGPLLPPRVIEGLDEILLLSGLGAPDAVKLSINGDAVASIGASSSIDFVGFLNGQDFGNIFAYAPTGWPVSVDIGLGAGLSIEVGGIWDFGGLENFNRTIFQGKEAGFSASFGNYAASAFLGLGGTFEAPAYWGLTFGLGVGTPLSANGTAWSPDYSILDWDLNGKKED